MDYFLFTLGNFNQNRDLSRCYWDRVKILNHTLRQFDMELTSDGFQDRNLLFQGAIFRFHVARVMFQSEIKVLKRPQGVFVRGGNTS